MPVYHCQVFAFFDEDLREVAAFPFQMEGHHDPRAGFVFGLATQLEAVLGRPCHDPLAATADESVREAVVREEATPKPTLR